MTVSFPSPVTRNLVSTCLSPMRTFIHTQCVMSPILFRVPSTLYTLIVFRSGVSGIRLSSTNLRSRKVACAPESTSARTWYCWSTIFPSPSSVIGNKKDLSFGSATSTGERDNAGAVADVDAGCHSKNPPSRGLCRMLSVPLHLVLG
jgi:hypothetical protein